MDRKVIRKILWENIRVRALHMITWFLYTHVVFKSHYLWQMELTRKEMLYGDTKYRLQKQQRQHPALHRTVLKMLKLLLLKAIVELRIVAQLL